MNNGLVWIKKETIPIEENHENRRCHGRDSDGTLIEGVKGVTV
jgi:hypothetical protein